VGAATASSQPSRGTIGGSTAPRSEGTALHAHRHPARAPRLHLRGRGLRDRQRSGRGRGRDRAGRPRPARRRPGGWRPGSEPHRPRHLPGHHRAGQARPGRRRPAETPRRHLPGVGRALRPARRRRLLRPRVDARCRVADPARGAARLVPGRPASPRRRRLRVLGPGVGLPGCPSRDPQRHPALGRPVALEPADVVRTDRGEHGEGGADPAVPARHRRPSGARPGVGHRDRGRRRPAAGMRHPDPGAALRRRGGGPGVGPDPARLRRLRRHRDRSRDPTRWARSGGCG
jgi:hypothetical protein